MDPVVRSLLGLATLPRWLGLVAALRLSSAALGYAYPARLFGESLETQLFDRANVDDRRRTPVAAAAAAAAEAAAATAAPGAPQFSRLAARLFAMWTIASGAVCVAAALDGTRRTLMPCLCTFACALAFFASEVFVFGTVSASAAARPAVVASISIAWIALELARGSE
jgi:hypothetical protein